MEPNWDYGTLRAWFVPRLGEDIVETELLRTFFPDEPVFDEGVGLALFHKHFLLYRRLWLFDDELREDTGHRLWIRGIRSTLLAPVPSGRCSFLDEESGLYCSQSAGEENLCPHHSANVPQKNGMRAYYLDWGNLEAMTDEGVKAMVDGFFRWMGRSPQRAAALEVLDLPFDADPETVKARWRQLSLEHHPDRGGDASRFKKISAAWTALKL